MALHQLPNARFEAIPVEGAAEAPHPRDVVRPLPRADLLDQPQPGLREPHRTTGDARCLDRAARHSGGVEHPGQPGWSGVLEHVPQREVEAQIRAQAAHQPRRRDGVAAEGEEVVVGPDLS